MPLPVLPLPVPLPALELLLLRALLVLGWAALPASRQPALPQAEARPAWELPWGMRGALAEGRVWERVWLLAEACG